MVDDATCAFTVFLVAGHVGDGEEGLGGMHVGVDAAIRVELGEFGVPRVDGKADFIIPEMPVVGFEGFVEQFVGTRAADELGGSGGEDHEGVGVADLACFVSGAVGGDGRIPTAVFVIVQRATQAGDRLVDEFGRARFAMKEAEGIDVSHTAGDPRVDALGQIRLAGVIQPVGAALWCGEMMAEMQEFIGFRLE